MIYLTHMGGTTATGPDENVTRLLKAWAAGDQQKFEELVPAVYPELHRIAARYMRRERAGETLQTTALLNEAYLRLVKSDLVEWRDRTHFFAVCARIMRRILVDAARGRNYAKRGGDAQRVSFDEQLVGRLPDTKSIVALDDALSDLAKFDPRKAEVVELRFFGGLSVEESAEILDVSPQTVLRDWKLAKAWLSRQLSGTP